MTSSYNPITGTSSADTLFGSTSADSIDALGGDDIVYNGGSENDIVALGTGNDSINFSSDADGAEIYGQGGNDSLGFTASLKTSTVSGGTANDTIWISKVKGHATDLMVQRGEVQQEHKRGNDLADAAAAAGVKRHTPGLDMYVQWLEERRGRYIELITKIQVMAAAVLQEASKRNFGFQLAPHTTSLWPARVSQRNAILAEEPRLLC